MASRYKIFSFLECCKETNPLASSWGFLGQLSKEEITWYKKNQMCSIYLKKKSRYYTKFFIEWLGLIIKHWFFRNHASWGIIMPYCFILHQSYIIHGLFQCSKHLDNFHDTDLKFTIELCELNNCSRFVIPKW